MGRINQSLTQNENVFNLLTEPEGNPGLAPYIAGLVLGNPAVDTTVAGKNTRIPVTAAAGSGLQEGTTEDYRYTRLSLADDAMLGTFDNIIYVPEGSNQQSIQDQVIVEAGIVGEAVQFTNYTAVDFEDEVFGSITVTSSANSKLYIGEAVIELRIYVPTVADMGPNTNLNGFTGPI